MASKSASTLLRLSALLLGAVLALAGGLVLPPLAVPGTDVDRTAVICWTFDSTGREKHYRVEPNKCVMFKRGAESYAEGVAATSRVRWRWENNRAKGKGKLAISTVGPVPARFRLTKPVEKCGEKVFSKLNVQYRVPPQGDFDGDRGHYAFHLETC